MNIDFGITELNDLKARGVRLGIQSVVVEHRTTLATPDGHPCDLKPSVSVTMQPHCLEAEETSEIQSWKAAYLSALQEVFFSGESRNG